MRLSNGQKALLAILLVGLVILTGYWYAFSCRENLSPEEKTCPVSQKVLPFVDAVPFMMLAAVIAGAVAFHLLSPKPTQKFNEATLKFLTGDERVIVQRLIEKNGEALQSELTHLSGMSKVRSHRAVKKLIEKEVVTVQQNGKTNIVKLSREIYSTG